jgi:hypothetical protein
MQTDASDVNQMMKMFLILLYQLFPVLQQLTS